MNEKIILQNALSIQRPEFPLNVNSEWIDLINMCWDKNYNKKYYISEIIDKIESYDFIGQISDIDTFNDYKKAIQRTKINYPEYKKETNYTIKIIFLL